MSSLTTTTKNETFNHLYRNTAMTSPTAIYASAYLSDPTDAGTGTEASAGNYARQAITFAAPVDGVATNSVAVEFPLATVAYASAVTHFAIHDALTLGTMMNHGLLTLVDGVTPAPQTILINNRLVYPIGSITMSIQ